MELVELIACWPPETSDAALLASRIMRTTLNLDASLLEELRRRGAREGKSLGEVASEALARGLAGGAPAAAAPLGWTSRDLGEPYVDLEDKEALHAALDGRR